MTPLVPKIATLLAASIGILATTSTAYLPIQATPKNQRTTLFRVNPFQPKLKLKLNLKRIPATTTSLAAVQTDDDDDGKFTLSVALTREAGKNQKLKEQITNHPSTLLLADTLTLNQIEMPCVQHAIGPDVPSFLEHTKHEDKPPCAVLGEKYDYLVITSPESAKVLFKLLDSPPPASLAALPTIAAVGKATARTLGELGFEVSFTPSRANGEALVTELPPVDKVGLNRVLYPASAQADDTIQDGLEGGRKDCTFVVKRFDTYDTVPVVFDGGERGVMMDGVDMALFGSPSAVRAWLGNVDAALGVSEEDGSLEERMKGRGNCNGNVVAVCIGKTTAKACLESKRWVDDDIYYPEENPGMKGWVDSCLIAAGDVMEKSFWG